MISAKRKSKVLRVVVLILMTATLCLCPGAWAYAQGSIFGAVTNSDASVPANGEMRFFGFLDDTDEEIRIETSVGAGYDGGNWYDDFQNYLTEAPGNPYDYYFYNTTNGEGFILSNLIPINSFQQEDIALAPVDWPTVPTGLTGRTVSTSSVVISWQAVPDHTYHVYSRTSSSNGSLFRIDDPTGNMANHGVADSFYVDNTVNGVFAYNYLIISEDTLGNLSPHSAFVNVNSSVAMAPEVISITPNAGPAAGGTEVVILGRGFDMAGATVTIGGVNLVSPTVVSPFEITGTTAAGPDGPVDVVVTNTASGLPSNAMVGGFLYEPSTVPVVSDIPDQTIPEGSSFASIKLDDYVADPDNADNEISWSYSGNVDLSVNINVNRIAAIQIPGPDWFGSETITFRATDPDSQFAEDAAVFTVTSVNDPPVLNPIGPQFVAENANLNFNITASDPDGTIPNLSTSSLPANASFTDNLDGTGTFDFNPDYTQEGIYPITFYAGDGQATDSEVVTVTVTHVNQPPVLNAIGTQVVAEGNNLNVVVTATDPDGEIPALTTSSLPANATFVDNLNGTGTFDFNPDFNQQGVYTVTFYASDGLATDSEVVTINVVETNLPPVLDPIGPQTVAENSNLNFGVSASDPDSTIPALTTSTLPANATFTDNGDGTGTFNFNPSFEQAGVYPVTFYASDGLATDSEVVSITVTNVNRDPILNPVGNKTVAENANLNFNVTASDPDGNIPALTTSTLPTNATFTDNLNGTGTFDFNPDFEQSGVYPVTFYASDGTAIDSEVISITVTNTNRAPILNPIGPQTVAEGANLNLTITASDPDGTIPTLASSILPTNATFTDNLDGTGTFDFNPDITQEGVYPITFFAGDGEASDSEVVTVTVTHVNQPPVVSDIPNQAIIGAGSYAVINLDDYVSDSEDADSLITWSVSGDNDLAVDITDRIATVTIANPDWSGTETIVLRATDRDGEFAEDSVTFVQVKVAGVILDYNNVLVGRTDSAGFDIITPAGFTLVAPQIIASSGSITIHREDGAASDADIPPATASRYWALWTPSDTMDVPGNLNLSSISVDDDEQVNLTGRAVTMTLTPDFASYDFGDVNAVDRRASDTMQVGINIAGNTGGTITGFSIDDAGGNFNISPPHAGDTLLAGVPVELTVLSHPQNAGNVSASLWLTYSIDLGDEVATDSIDLLSLNATGVVPECAIAQDTLNFYTREIGPTYTLPFTLSNNSTVPEIIDSLYFGAYNYIFRVDSTLAKPLFLMPGDTDITVYFRPLDEMDYVAGMVVVDSNAAGDCDPPVALGTGVLSVVHWDPDTPLVLGVSPVCESSTAVDFAIINKVAGFDMVVDNITVDSSGWFTFYPGLDAIIGSTYAPNDNISFDSINFAPRDILGPTTFRMTLEFHVDTTGASIDFLTFGFISQSGACAGILNATNMNFASAQVGRPLLDTLIISNGGACDLTLDSIKSDIADFTFSSPGLPYVVPSGQDYGVEVTFRPSVLGSRNGHLTVYHDGYVAPFDLESDCPLSNQTAINLSGTGIDTSPPQVAEIIAHNCGQTLEIVTTDIGVGVQSLATSWRKGNAVGGYTATRNSPSLLYTNHYQLQFSALDLPPDSVNFLGYEIRAIAVDGAGNADTVFQSVAGCLPIDVEGGGRITAGNWLNGDDSLWHLVSFPGYLPTYQAREIFEHYSGLPPSLNTDDDTWRLYEYSDGGFDAVVTSDPSAAIEPGRGYWFRHFQALDTLQLDTTGGAITWATLPVFPIHLDYGWNLIGSPFLFPVYINDTLIDSDSVSSFVGQAFPALSGGSNWWAITDIGAILPSLQPWKGYALWCENPGGYTIYLDPHYHPVQPSPQAGHSWAASLSLSSSSGSLGKVEIGIDPNSNDGPDMADVRPITLFNRPSAMNIENEPFGRFMRDIRPEADLQIWRLDISTGVEEALLLSWSATPEIDPDKAMILYDVVTERRIDMKIQKEYAIENPGQIPPDRFRIYFGNESLVKAAIDNDTPARPMTFRLYQNYPNPFNPVTTISYDLPRPCRVTVDIFNILGQRVIRLEDGYREAGSYQIRWDGREVASGVYFYRIQADEFAETRKMLLIK